LSSKAKILVIDDEAAIRSSLKGVLEDEGFLVALAEDGSKGLDAIAMHRPDVVLLDIWMPGRDGLEILEDAKKRSPQTQFVVMSGHGTIETAVKATKLGAFDFLEKPLSTEKLLIMINNILHLSKLRSENSQLLSKVKRDITMVGESEAFRQLKQMISRVAPTNSWVLITGENGTGKELVAQNIHYQSNRAGKMFVELNCAAIPEDLIESELFGHEKGAFTGASAQKKGKFDIANGGTLFLDEIGDMSLKTQAKILRILQEQKFERVGGHDTISVDVRVVAATNKNLEEEIKAGRFREDLYYRLNVIPFRVPSLRERRSDIPLLIKHFTELFAKEMGGRPKHFTPEALKYLTARDWPGNIRELRNFVERVFILTPGDIIEVGDLQMAGIGPADNAVLNSGFFSDQISSDSLREARAEFEKAFILRKLKENDNNISKTAEVIGVERSHLHRKIKSYGIEV